MVGKWKTSLSFRQRRRFSCPFGQKKAENQQCKSHTSADPFSGERCTNHRRRCRYPNYRNACCRRPSLLLRRLSLPRPSLLPLPSLLLRPSSLPPVVAAPLVVATPAVGNSTPGTTSERGQVIGFSSSGDNIQAFIGPSSESFSITTVMCNY